MDVRSMKGEESMREIPKAGEFYRHFKNKLYQIIAVAEHAETNELLVIYQALYGSYKIYAKPLSMFVSPVDREKYPDADQEYRFERVCFSSDNMESASCSDEEQQTSHEPKINPWLSRFLDAEGYEEQIALLGRMRGEIGQRELDSLYLILDIPHIPGDEETQIQMMIKHLQTRQRYDGRRLR